MIAPRGRRPGVAVLLAISMAVMLGACTDGGGSALPDPTSEAPADDGGAVPAATTPPLDLAPGQTAHTVGEAFQYGTFEVVVGEVVYDEGTASLLVGLRFRNLGDAWAMPETAAALVVDGVEHPVLGTVVDIPPRMSADVTWTVESLDGDPVPGGELRWGRPDRDQPVIHLDGSGENLWRPTDVDVEGWAGIGKYTIHVTGGVLLAASPELGAQADPGTRILRLYFEAFTHRLDPVNGFYPLEHLTLRRPDGTTVEGVGSSPGHAPVSWTATAGNFVDFPVAADVSGDYEVLLSSLSPLGFSTLHPELVERVAIPFSLDVPAAPETAAAAPLPVPELRPTDATDQPATVALVTEPLNVGGFLFSPTELRYDPAGDRAALDGTVTSIETVTPSDMEDLVGGLLDAPPQFSFTFSLVSGGRFATGVLASDPTVDPAAPTPVTIEFLGVGALDLDDLGLVIGPRTGAASTLPLTAASALPHHPPAPVVARAVAPEVTAGDWTVTIDGYRVGFLTGTSAPRPGSLELELFLTVTASPSAVVRSLGLSFRPSVQVFLAQADGYMQQPTSDSGLVFYEPGETKRQSVTFQVADVFTPGTRSFVLRSADESTEVTIDQFVETTFAAELVAGSGEGSGGGL